MCGFNTPRDDPDGRVSLGTYALDRAVREQRVERGGSGWDVVDTLEAFVVCGFEDLDFLELFAGGCCSGDFKEYFVGGGSWVL